MGFEKNWKMLASVTGWEQEKVFKKIALLLRTIGENNQATRNFLLAIVAQNRKPGPQITKNCDWSKKKDLIECRPTLTWQSQKVDLSASSTVRGGVLLCSALRSLRHTAKTDTHKKIPDLTWKPLLFFAVHIYSEQTGPWGVTHKYLSYL